MSNINWYPGHMARTIRELSEMVSSVDAVAEVIDARIPVSSRNRDLDRVCNAKPRIIIMNRSDLADPNETKKWADKFKEQGMTVLVCNSKQGIGTSGFFAAVKTAVAERLARLEKRGLANLSVKVVVVGIPNVGKSSFINRLAGRKTAKAEDRPGVTRKLSWIHLTDGLDLLDSPGLLPPKMDQQRAARHLAYTGAIKDEIMDAEELASGLWAELTLANPGFAARMLAEKIDEAELPDEAEAFPEQMRKGYGLLELFCQKRGFLVKGGFPDTERGARIFLDEFRSGKLGAFTLEPAEYGKEAVQP